MYKNVYDIVQSIFTDNPPTVEELEEIGFIKWSQHHDLYLIPNRLFDFIPDGTIVTSIYGYEAIKGVHDFDRSNTFGCLTWGVIISQEKQTL